MGSGRVVELFLVLSNIVRVQVLRELAVKDSCSFSELYRVCKVSAGTLAYHLNVLRELVSKEGKDYCLTEPGRHAYGIIKESEELEDMHECSR